MQEEKSKERYWTGKEDKYFVDSRQVWVGWEWRQNRLALNFLEGKIMEKSGSLFTIITVAALISTAACIGIIVTQKDNCGSSVAHPVETIVQIGGCDSGGRCRVQTDAGNRPVVTLPVLGEQIRICGRFVERAER